MLIRLIIKLNKQKLCIEINFYVEASVYFMLRVGVRLFFHVRKRIRVSYVVLDGP